MVGLLITGMTMLQLASPVQAQPTFNYNSNTDYLQTVSGINIEQPAGSIDPQTQQTNTRTLPATGDPTLMQYASELGLDLPDGMTLVYAPEIPPADDLSPTITAGVFYASSKTIYIQQGNYTAWQIKNILAYEFMHWVWQSVASGDERQAVTLEAGRLMQQSPEFRADMGDFDANNIPTSELEDEADANICTRVPRYQLSDATNQYCDKYLPNRSIIL